MKKLAALCLLVLAAASAHADTRTDFRTPASFAGGRQPQLAVSSTGTIFVVFGRDNEIFLSKSTDNGDTFSTPQKVATLTKLALGMRRGPRIAVSDHRIVITAAGDDLQAFISEDGGSTFSSPVRINDKSTSAREDLDNIAALPDGSFYAVWLDDRTGKKQIEGARLDPTASAFSENVVIYKSPDGEVCQCCHPSVIADAKGNLYVMFRNLLAGNRDFYLTQSTDGGKTFGDAQKLGAGYWKFNACPMDGGNLVATPDGVVTIWRRMGDVYLDHPGQPETKLISGQQPVVAELNGKLIYAYQDKGDLTIAGEGRPSDSLSVTTQPQSGTIRALDGPEPGSFASLIAAPDGKSAYITWESPSGARFAIIR